MSGGLGADLDRKRGSSFLTRPVAATKMKKITFSIFLQKCKDVTDKEPIRRSLAPRQIRDPGCCRRRNSVGRGTRDRRCAR